jgi:hypothetical protein
MGEACEPTPFDVTITGFGDVAQLVRASGSYPLGHPFKSGRRYHPFLSPKMATRLPVNLRGYLRLGPFKEFSVASELPGIVLFLGPL